ncbi:DNA damage-inducible protein 1-like protein [Tanacetum coccineum]|uniref:DNA damage-inducible protein 1-like protein n=1 Tax=Tanacetum coccineum TaxID=301880 RepID=A0ABQ5BFL3_9ASTR
MEDPRLFTLPCRIGDFKPFDTLADLGSCVNIIQLYLFKKLSIGLSEETHHVFRLADGTKSYPVGIFRDVEVYIGRLKLLNDFYIIDMKKDPETPLLVGRGFLATANAVIDCRKDKIVVGEGIIGSLFRVKGIKLDASENFKNTSENCRECKTTLDHTQLLEFAAKTYLKSSKPSTEFFEHHFSLLGRGKISQIEHSNSLLAIDTT